MKMIKLKIDQLVWHPCSMDIIEHKVISIRTFKSFNHYVLKATHNVGACGRVEVIISQNKDNLTFVELIDAENIQHASGLQDFIEGKYYVSKDEAELVFYNQQLSLWRGSIDKHKTALVEAEKHYQRVKIIVDTAKQRITEKK